MALNDKSLAANLNEDLYREEHIPPVLLRPGQAVWRFKRYFGLLKPKKAPQTEYDLIESAHQFKQWITKVHIFQPKQVVFTAKSSSKKKSEGLAMAKGLLWLRDNNFVDHSFNPILTTIKEKKSFEEQNKAPIDIKSIDEDIKHDMKTYIKSFNENIRESIIKICGTFNEKELRENWDKDSEELYSGYKDSTDSRVICNVLTDGVFKKPNNYELNEREEDLKLFVEQRMRKEKTELSFAQLRQKVSNLPIAKFREQIVDTIQQNRVVVISGDTGCGKTTQVPQYIFDNEINNERGAFANIIVTQPRRLSAISISERVALEFGEESVGNSIGYHVRFDKSLPNYNEGAMLFCTAGILLRKLEGNPRLKGVSHVIIDEVHERDVIIDFLLVLLKRVLQLNPEIRIILMSASMNAHLFVDYFDSCPLIEIPGRCFEVEHLYLNDFTDKIGRNSLTQRFSARNPKIDKDMIISLIDYINKNKGDGAILCFLPGWADIQTIQTELKFLNENNNDLLVIPVHSKLPHQMQRKIFAKPPVGVRKVVLSTNIAETSLTIDDVVYVIDPGLSNEMRYNTVLNVSAFGTHWISKANAKQRSGRAGRVKAGQCYRLYSKEIENAFMDDFPTPELLRVPLESVVMQAKLHCSQEEVEKFLSEVPQSPSPEAIKSAIKSLKEIKVMDEKENLTILGKRIVNFTTHPRLSVALVYSSMFGCLTSMLSLVSQMSANREPFQVMPDQKSIVREIKKRFSFDMLSDHISLVHITNEYENISNNSKELSSFCEKNYLGYSAMKDILDTKKLFASHLEESQFIEKNSWKYTKSNVNSNWHRKQLIIASLIPGLSPNYVRLMGGELKKLRINWHKLRPIDVNSGKKVKFVSESLFSSSVAEKVANSIIVYFGSFYSQEARMLTIRDASVVSPISLLLFCDNNFQLDLQNQSKLTEDESVVILRNNNLLKLKINKADLELISQWNLIMDLFSQWFVVPQNLIEKNPKIGESLKEFIQLTDDLMLDSSRDSEEKLIS